MINPKSKDASKRRSLLSSGAQPPGDFASLSSGPDVYLSWDGVIYGPATEEEVIKGVRTSWFDERALYWHEGLNEWKPVYGFNSLARKQTAENWSNRKIARPHNAPSLSAQTSRKAGTNSSGLSKPRPRKGERQNLLLVATFALLAVILTVGILLLLMLV